MKKVEILSPVGNQEMLKMAVNNGADAVYLAGKLYGARKFALNFENEDLIEVVKYCHLYGVKVYVTVNTIIYESEVTEFLKYINFLCEINVDAVIMQDLGMIKVVRKMFPDLEIHASTQMHNHNPEGIKYLQSLGVKRVVLARELTLEEIKNINIDIEKEMFVYGALCISYSGQCLFSSQVLNRSGNRGECAGMCRLPYKLVKNQKAITTKGDYLLSPKELNTLSRLREIINSGVDSLKIEGRMKSPEYVGYVTKVFRRLVDCYYNNEEMNLYKEEIKSLKKLYNREFTLGHAFLERNGKLMNIEKPNHQGTILGYAKVEGGKIAINLEDDIAQGDGIRFANNSGMIVNFLYNKEGLLINSAKKGDIVYVKNKVKLKDSGVVLKTYDIVLSQTINDIKERKVPVNIEVEAYVSKPLKATITDFEHTLTKQLGTVEQSISSPVKVAEIVDRFSKLGNTIFELRDINVFCDKNIFIPVRVMNDLRRELVEGIVNLRLKRNSRRIIENVNFETLDVVKTKNVSFRVYDEKHLKYLLNKKVNIYVSDYSLYKKYKAENVFFVTDRVSFNNLDLTGENIVASNLSGTSYYAKNNNIVSDIYLNVVNSSTVYELHSLGVKRVGLSCENKIEDLKNLMEACQNNYGFLPNVEVVVYGRIELMVMKYCPLNMFINDKQICDVCKSDDKYYLEDRNGKKFPLVTRNCKSYVLSCEKIDCLNQLKLLENMGINNFVVNIFDENIEQINSLLKTFNLDII